MEQLFEAFGINWRLLIAQAVNFGVVMFALWYLLYKPVLKMLDARRALISKGVADAKDAAEKLQNADKAAAEVVGAADTEAKAIVERARLEAGEERSKLVGEAQARAERVVTGAESEADEIRSRALRESEREIARLAVLAAEKVLKAK